MKWWIVLMFFVINIAQSASVTLAWNPSSSPCVTGYNIYYGITSTNLSYKNSFLNTNCTETIYGLIQGTTYYFAATSTSDINSTTNESTMSNEVCAHIPFPIAISMTVSNGIFISGNDAYSCYEIMGTTNLTDWYDVTNLDGTNGVVLPEVKPHEFFRLKVM